MWTSGVSILVSDVFSLYMNMYFKILHFLKLKAKYKSTDIMQSRTNTKTLGIDFQVWLIGRKYKKSFDLIRPL